ncbi:tetratricopeptide repeat protein [Acetobacteraceae bacterium KSS8]|uniref:Tetratricopeptide repeat protein n=1 Tax=Endosaccharibacter trunci TaxID=2812733 RepID=A0ABT1W9T4_9PROT|nr:tetratricopeptide repeat protein [Acetobacteraceae bacterium KSS8]
MHRSLVPCTALAAVLSCAVPLAARCSPVVPSPVSAAVDRGPAVAAGAYLAGIVAGHEGDSSQAADFMFRALAADPNSMAVRAPAFLFAAMAGDPRAARLASLPGSGMIGALVSANQAASSGDWRAAANAYAGLNDLPLAHAVRPLLLAWALQGEGRTDDALQVLAQVPGNSPLAGAVALEAGSIADYAGKVAAAASLYRTVQGVFQASGLGSVQLIGSYLARNGHPAEAAAMVQALAQRIPAIGMIAPGLVRSLDRPVISSPSEGLARAYLAIALAMLDGENAASADSARDGRPPGEGHEVVRFMLRFALVMDPHLTAARLSLADLIAPAHPHAALELLGAVPASDPLSPLVSLRIATLLASTGQTAASLDRLHAITASLPDRPEPWQTLGDVLSDAKQFGAAIPAYDRAMAARRKLNGGHLSGDDWQLLFARAVAFDRQNQWTKARADLDHALALSPTEPFLLNYLGYSLVERNEDLPQARTLIRRALVAKPDDGAIRDSLGWVMLREGDVPGAVTTLERAAEQNPEDPTVNFHLGAAYWAAGRHTEAEDQWRWALVLGPDSADADKIRDALKRAEQASAQSEGAAK